MIFIMGLKFYHRLSCGSKKWRLGQQHGFVLIGHCFGGLVIKSLVEVARKRARLGNVRKAIERKAKASAEMFLENLKGVVFYAVPHSGSENLISYFSRCNQITIPRRVVKLAGFMENVQSLQLKMENLSTTFDDIVEERSINVCAFVEGKPMKDVVSGEFMHVNIHLDITTTSSTCDGETGCSTSSPLPMLTCILLRIYKENGSSLWHYHILVTHGSM